MIHFLILYAFGTYFLIGFIFCLISFEGLVFTFGVKKALCAAPLAILFWPLVILLFNNPIL